MHFTYHKGERKNIKGIIEKEKGLAVLSINVKKRTYNSSTNLNK